MTDHTDLLNRLQSAEVGSAELGAEVLTAVTGDRHKVGSRGRILEIGEGFKCNPTTDRNAIAELEGEFLASRPEYTIQVRNRQHGCCVQHEENGLKFLFVAAKTECLARCAALLSAINTGGGDD